MKIPRSGNTVFLAALACAAVLFPCGRLSAEGAKDDARKNPAPSTTQKEALPISIPQTIRPGDCLVVTFGPSDGIADAIVEVRTGDGRILADVPGFDVGGGRYVALVGISSLEKPGALVVDASARYGDSKSVARIVADLAVLPREFANEDIPLDGKNTAIRKDVSKKRLEEIRVLNELFAARRAEAPRFAGPWAAPVKSTRRTSEYGDRRTFVNADGTRLPSPHLGIDYGVPTGTAVFASGNGVVVMARERISTGWTVAIEHLPGVYSVYYHCDKLFVSEGDEVASGQHIANSGCTGLSTGPHLHHEYRVGSVPVSPDWFYGRILF